MYYINYFFKSFFDLDRIFTIILTLIILKIILFLLSFVYKIIKKIIKKIIYKRFLFYRFKILKFSIKRNINKLDILKTNIISFQRYLKETNIANNNLMNKIDKKDFYQIFFPKIENFNLNLQKNYAKELIDSLNFLFMIENHDQQMNFNNNSLIIIDNIIDHLQKELLNLNNEKNDIHININKKNTEILNIFQFIDVLYSIFEYTFEYIIESSYRREEFIKLKVLFTYNLFKEYFILKINIYLKKIIKKRWSILFKIFLFLILTYFFPNLKSFKNFLTMLKF